MKKLLTLLSLFMLCNFVQAQLTGVKTISATGGNYLTIQSAINDLNSVGVGSGGVTFLLTDGEIFTVNNSVDSLVITATGTVSNPIIFKQSGTGVKPIINAIGNAAVNGDAVLKLSGCDFLTVDGLDLRGDVNTEYGLFLRSPLGIDGCQNNTLQNCAVTMDKTNANKTYGVYSYVMLLTTTASSNKNNKFYNNTVQNCMYGYYLYNANTITTNFDENNEIGTVNSGSSIVTDIGLFGIYLYAQMNSKIFKNQITNIANNALVPVAIVTASANPNANLTGSVDIYNNIINNVSATTTSVYGIQFSQRKTSTNIYNNKVSNVVTTSDESDQASGIQIVGTYINGNLYNNLIYDIKAPSATTSPTVKGLDCRTGTAFNVYNNTVFLRYDAIAQVNRSVAFYQGSNVCDIRNNIFVNLTTVPADVTTGYAAAFFKNSTLTLADIAATCDRNLYYAGTPSTDSTHLIFYAHSTTAPIYIENLADFKTLLSPREQNSISQLPDFVNTAADSFNFRLATQLPVYGQPITTPFEILTDIDGNLRDATNPTIGAYEFNGSGIETELTANKLALTHYPNPFNNQTSINYSITSAGLTRVSVYNAQGQKVKDLFKGLQNPGKHSISFSADGLNSGVYFCKLENGNQNLISKLLLVK